MFYFTIISQKLNILIFRHKVFTYILYLVLRNIKYAFPNIGGNYILLNSGACCIEHT